MPKFKLFFALSALIAALVAAQPASADTIYLPLALNRADAGFLQSVELIASNPTTQVQRFSVFFLAENSDGSEVRVDPPQTVVGPGTTVTLAIGLEPGEIGMLEVTGPPEFFYSARLILKDAAGAMVTSTEMALVSSANLFEANQTAQIQGLEKTAQGQRSDFGLVNLSDEPASCNLAFFRSGGATITGSALIAMQPRSMRFFPDAFAILGANGLRYARFRVTCDQRFWPFGTVAWEQRPEILFIEPAFTGRSRLTPPGEEEAGTVRFDVPGLFLDARPGDSRAAFEIPIEPGVAYKRITVDFDFYFNGYVSPLFHTLSSLRSNGPFWVVSIRGDRNRTILESNRSGTGEGGAWERRTTYHVRVTADVETNQILLEVFDGSILVEQLSLGLGRSDLGSSVGRPLVLDFSQDRVFDDAYFPLWGSRFSDLQVRAVPFAP